MDLFGLTCGTGLECEDSFLVRPSEGVDGSQPDLVLCVGPQLVKVKVPLVPAAVATVHRLLLSVPCAMGRTGVDTTATRTSVLVIPRKIIRMASID